MKRFFFLFLGVLLFSSSIGATEDRIVEKTHLSKLHMWRYDFEYATVDIDGKTPITLSGAIFMSEALHDKKETAKGSILLTHHTITQDDERPTNASMAKRMEPILQTSNNFVIESDGIGFGKTVDHPQCYLQGRAVARVHIDGFIAGRKLLAAEGYDTGSLVFSLGYSQGGHNGMWVHRLMAEGYRNDELPKINYSIIGGGPYDIYAMYREYIETDYTQFPVGLQLIINETASYTDFGFTLDDLFVPEITSHISELYDSKKYTTGQINDSIYTILGSSSTDGIAVSSILKPIFFDEKSELMQHLTKCFKENSLVYEKWTPSKCDSIQLIHSIDDEVVPYFNVAHLDSFLQEQSYTHYNIYDMTKIDHATGGAYYTLMALKLLNQYISNAVTGTETNVPSATTVSKKDKPCSVYTINGRLVRKDADPNNPLQGLSKGIYIVNGEKRIVR